jgi:hypothetical protein
MSDTAIVYQNKVGRAVTATMRELLVKHNLCDFKTALEISTEFDALIKEADWLETLNGTAFDKSFVPSYFSSK